MRNKNTMSLSGYIVDHILWGCVCLVWYKNILFRCVKGMDYHSSMRMLVFFLLVLVFAGIALTYRKRRNTVSVFINISCGFSLYTFIAYKKIFPVAIWSVIILGIILSILYGLLLFKQLKSNKKHIFPKHINWFVLGARTIIGSCAFGLVLLLGISAIFHCGFFRASVNIEKPMQDKYTIAENIDVIANLKESVWCTLSTREKTDTLQTVCNIEASYYNLPHGITLSIGILREGLLASYDDRCCMVTVNLECLAYDEAREVLDSVLHECRHAFQHNLAEVFETMDDTYKGLRYLESSSSKESR